MISKEGGGDLKRVFSILLAVSFLLTFSACGNQNVATAYDVAITHNETVDTNVDAFQESFLSASIVQGDWCISSDSSDAESFPETRTILVDNQEDFDATFANCPIDVNLDSEMIVIYTASSNNRRETKVKKAFVSDGTLTIELYSKHPKNGGKDTCTPYQRYVIVKLDKASVNQVEVTYTKK